MKLSDSLVGVLRCPENKQRLTLATPEELAEITKSNGGSGKITGALIREDRLVAYPIDDGYPVLLIDRQLKRSSGNPL